jgi:hypothetical protein
VDIVAFSGIIMIVFDLKCAFGHTFEGWFDDNRDFEFQKDKGLLTCPVCNDGDISKALSTFAIKGATEASPQKRHADELAALGAKLLDFVEKNFDNVGADFAKEALKMHYGVAEQRNIRGYSTQAEEKTLQEEGVPFFKFPPKEPADS